MNNKLKFAIRITALTVIGFLLGFTTTSLFAQEAKSLIWKIEGNGLEKPSYIYGTIHAICKDDFFLTEAVNKSFEASEQVVMELDMDDPQLMQKMQQGSINVGMKNISSDFKESDKKVVNEFLQTNYGADLTQLGILKPFSLVSLVIAKTIPCTEIEQYEMTFVTKAKEKNIEVLSLESVAFQTSILDNFPMEQQIGLLVESITEFEKGQEEFRKMVEAYKNQDLNELTEIMKDSDQFAPFEEVMITKRNADWISKIEKFAKEKPTFFAVGAMHLPGEKGVLALLKKQGFKVTPL